MIVKGVLNGMSDGHGLPGYTERAYIKVNEKRYKRIAANSVVDNILIENIGNEVEVSLSHSLLGGNLVCAIKEANGEVSKASIVLMVLLNLIRFTLYFLLKVFLGFCTMLFSSYSDINFDIVLLIIYIFPLISLIKEIKARHALK